MIKRNIYQAKYSLEPNCHGGQGVIKFRRILEKEFGSQIAFLDYTILPPGTTISYHPHPDSEETYIILKGKGKMTVNQEESEVTAGDVIHNPKGGSHGLVNHSDQDLEILVFEGQY